MADANTRQPNTAQQQQPAASKSREVLAREALITEYREHATLAETYPVARLRIDEVWGLSEYGMRDGDVFEVLLDGDFEYGDLALYTWWDDELGEAVGDISFLFIESDEEICIREETRLQCQDCHLAPEEITIAGRVVGVRRRNLPVRLTCDLRPLPFAEDVQEGGDSR